MKNENEKVEMFKNLEDVVKEPVVEVLGKFSEMSRAKFGGRDISPTKRKK